MSMPLPEKIKEFMFNPSHAFRQVRDERAGETFVYLLALVVFCGAMATVMTFLAELPHPFSGSLAGNSVPAPDPAIVIVDLVTFVLVTLVATVVYGLWLHIWVYLLGGRRGVWQTEKSLFYAATPTLILAWIPVIGTLVGMVWTVIISVAGIRELQGLDDNRAAIAVILGVVIAVVVVVLIVGGMIYALLSSLPMTSSPHPIVP